MVLASLLFIPCCKKADEQVSRPPDSSNTQVAHSEDDFLKEYVPTEYLDAVKANLKSAGENKDELIKVIKAVKPEERKGASFLIATLPFPDIAAISSDILLEHIRYAYLVKNKYPWMKNMPEEIFLHYVLPYRCSTEPIEAYRKYFYEQLDPIVSQLDNLSAVTPAGMADVAHQVNLWLGNPNAAGKKRVRFVQTDARTQGPLETLKTGYGRCEEMTVIYVAAARSVGVPCRAAHTPEWAICDNNHAWVEFWVNGAWKPLGGCEPGAPWFENPTKRAAIVYSIATGLPESEQVYKSYPLTGTFKTSSIINSIKNYSRTCDVHVTVLSPAGEKMAGTGVALSVFNWGVFSKFINNDTDENGSVVFTTGIGEYFLSAGKDNLRAWQVVKTEPDKKLDIVLRLSENSAPDGFVFLKYPTPDEAKESFNTPEFYSTVTHKEPLTPSYSAPAESYFAEEFEPSMAPDIAELLQADEQGALPSGQGLPIVPRSEAERGKITLQKLKTALGNWHELVSAIQEIAPEKRADLLWLISQMAHSERIQATKQFLLDNVNYAYLARSGAPYKISDELFRPYVLNPSFEYLHLSPWRDKIYRAFIQMACDTVTETARAVNEWVDKNISLIDAKSVRCFYVANPLDVYKSRSGREYETALFTAAVLRTLGIPAQIKSKWVEFHNGAAWVPLYPHDQKNFGNTFSNEASKTKYVAPAGLKVILSAKGITATNPTDKMGLAQFKDGYWSQVDSPGRKGLWLLLSPGEYLLTAGIRDSNGDPYVYCRQIELESGQGMTINLSLDIPVNLVSDAERIVRQLPKLPDVELSDAKGDQPTPVLRLHNLKASLQDSNILLVFFSLDNEPSLRMMPLIDSTLKTLREANVIVWGIYVDPDGETRFAGDDRLNNLGMTVLFDAEQKVVKEFIPDFDKNKSACLPSTILISKEGKIVMWREGYNLDIAKVIESALALLSEGKPLAGVATEAAVPEIKIVPFDSSGPDYIGDGEKYYKEGRYQDAVDSYRKALEDGDDVDVWYNLACSCSLLGQVDGALEALKQAIKCGYREWHWMDNDPDLANVRADPRYKELRK